ncbi:MAG: hypothetical protein DYG98_27305 [Haliscomenobacteraceae bacterium CHB4]|nr:hypothetical protein [Haliscomenobacteraceae bacterium CHB4]
MKQSLIRLALPALFCFAGPLQAQQIQMSVTAGSQPPYNDLPELIRQHLTGSGIDILEVEYSGVPEAIGYFTGGDSAVGLHRGLLMTTGHAQSTNSSIGADEVGNEFASTYNGSVATDPVLAALVNAPLAEIARYHITFRPRGDSIRFRYVFASEEYPEFSCSPYNDVFGFFLSGPGPDGAAPYQNFNIALVPGTNLPVAINNIHPANSVYPNCPPFNVQYYNDNNFSLEQPTYDGLTDVFVAEAAVVPCAVYQMTLSIADAADGVYDSAVFLEANSFEGEPDIAASFAPGANVIPENAQADTISLSFAGLPADLLPLTVTIGGAAQNGIDYQETDSIASVFTADTTLYFLFQPIADAQNEGFETITLTVSADSSCFTRTFMLYLADPDSLFQPEEVVYLVNGSATLDAPPTFLSGTSWTFSNETDVPIAPTNTLVHSETVVNVLFSHLDDIALIESVCLNIQHGWDDDLDIYLFAPNNRFVELSTDNGGNGDNYTGTCFAPTAALPIHFPGPFAPPSAAPFTGVFQPEGQWSDILFTPLNGTWKIGVKDDMDGFSGTLLDWSITFSGKKIGAFKYLWSTGDTTSELIVGQPGTYKVTVSNAVCAFEKTFIVLPECPSSALQLYACPGASVVFDTLVLNENNPSGVIAYDLPGDCDSLVFVSVSFFPPAFDSVSAVIQQGQAYEVGGQTFIQAGDYNIVLTSVNGCDSIVSLHLEVLTGVAAPAEQAVRVQPNPALDKVWIAWDKNLMINRIKVFSSTGNLMFETEILSNAMEATIGTDTWPAGIYLLALETPGVVVLRRLARL